MAVMTFRWAGISTRASSSYPSPSRSGRTVSVALLLALMAAMVLWLRNRSRPIQVSDPPEWPPLPPTNADRVADEALADAETAADDEAEAGAEAQDGAGDGAWRPPDPDGGCPDGFPVKANDKSGIFHVPGGRFYERTKPERCYPDAGSAIADGYRQAKT